MKGKICIALAFFLTAPTITAQSTYDWSDFVEEIYDETDEDETFLQNYILELEELRQHPIELNTATEDDFRQLPFLSDTQIKDILFYRERNGQFLSLGELMLVHGLDYATRQRLSLFCTVSTQSPSATAPSLRNLLRYASHEIVARTDFPLYTKEGYKDKPDSILQHSPNKVYLGNNNYHSLRYSLSSMNRLNAGLQIEKDGGEDEFDYVSAYLQYHSNRGLLRNVIIGDYKVGFAQGLVVNTSLSFGKLASMGNVGGVNRGFTRHSSMSESGHFRGIAMTMRPLKNLYTSIFFSYQKIDGTLRTDTVGAISSLKTDGLHRTRLERSKDGNLSETVFGGNIQWTPDRWQLAATLLHAHLSIPLMPKYNTPSTLYRRYNPQGSDFTNASLYYGYISNTLSVSGETAMSADGGVATLNSIRYGIGSTTTLSLTQRYYSKDYTSLYARSFGESCNVQNESGICLSLTTEPLRHLSLWFYADFFHFPYRKYQISDSSNGLDLLGQLKYTPSDHTTWQLRYRLKTKQKDVKINTTTTELYYYTTQQFRLQNQQVLSPVLTLKSTASFNVAFNPAGDNAYGYGLSEIISWKENKKPMRPRMDFSFSYFNTDTYDARIYTYEPSLLYSMGMTGNAYHGIRGALLLSADIFRNFTISCKVAATKYFNRDTIGSALEQIDRSHREDIQLQVRYSIK